ncbi:MAG: glycosyltransferase family 4 protein [Gammaproteobacteria bacterium]|nr:glycosyltransferase family 4 protein [Gammaproteobacteria bacterium]
MKVLHVEAGRHLYGGPAQVLLLLRGLRAEGVENVLVCPEGSAIAAASPAAQLRQVPLRGDIDVAGVPRLRRIIRQTSPDIVHLHSRRGADWIGGLASLRLGIPVVLSRRVDNRESRLLATAKYALVDRIIAISHAIYNVLHEAGVGQEKLVCVPDAVPPSASFPRDRQWLEQRFGVPPNVRLIGVIAQLIERKGHRVLINALPDIVRRHPDVRVMFFGDGRNRAALQQAIDDAGLNSVVTMPGFCDELERVLPNIDLVVHPALREGLGVAVLEALQAGLPVVASAAGGIPEAVIDGKSGLLVPPADAAALAKAVNSILADATLASALGHGGRATVAANFSAEKMVAGNLAVYRTV